MNLNAVAKIKMIKASVQCFVFGLLGLLPLIGFPFAAAALVLAGRVRVAQKRFWNPARAYCVWGTTCAGLGTIFWFGMVVLFVFNFVLHNWNG